jgi:uncharacterized protein (TIGR02246 family)
VSSVTTTTGFETNRQAILEVLRGVYDAWQANDAEAFVYHYLDDASVVQPGVYKRDRNEIQTTMGAAFAGPLKGSHAEEHPVDIRFLNDRVAIVIGEGGIVFPGQEAVLPEASVRATWVLAKRDENWYVAAYHNSPAC